MKFITKLIIFISFLQFIETTNEFVNFKWKYVNSRQLIEIEISTIVKSRDASKKYVAVAFAPTKKMTNADGYFCTNKGLKSFVIQGEYTDPKLLKGHQGVVLKRVGVKNGILSCTFTRRMSVTKTISGNKAYAFDFKMNQYYVLTATGFLKDDGTLLYHERSRHITPTGISFASGIPLESNTCNKTGKYCLTAPTGCSPDDPLCKFFSIKQIGNRFEIELSGSGGDGQQYMAIAFASSRIAEDADMYYCTGNELKSGVIRRRQELPVDLNDMNVRVMKASTEDGVAKCRFYRSACVTKEVTSGIRKEFDLTNDELFVLMAIGNLTEDGKLTYHREDYEFVAVNPMKFGASKPINTRCAQVDLVPETVESNLCNIAKGCIRYPLNCLSSSPDCMFFTFVQSSNFLNVELSGGIGDGQEYIALGFSEDENMKDVDVYYCDGLTVRSAVIGEVHTKPVTLTKSRAVTRAFAATTNGIGHCRFIRPTCVNKKIAGGKKHAFDLAQSEYNIFLVRGKMTADGGLLHHDYKMINKTDSPLMKSRNSYKCVDNTEKDLAQYETEDCSSGAKDCVRLPLGCSITQPDCAYFSYKQTGGSISFELSGGIGNGKGYVAVGFSKKNNLKDAYIYYCNGREMKSGLKRNETYRNVLLQDSEVRLTTTTTGGVGRCIFTEPGCIVKNDGSVNKTFNFLRSEFYVFLEVGKLNKAGKPIMKTKTTTIKRRLGKNANRYHFQECVDAGDSGVFIRANYAVIFISLFFKLMLKEF